MKTNLDYVIRSVTAPGETAPTLVPVIVNRIPSRSLSTVISNAIKNNLIAGLQESAVSGIAAGVADQIYDTLCEGRGVRFGSYFYVRPYLTGQTDANGTLTKLNGIDATMIAGPDFALTLDDFSLHFTGKDTQPKIDLVKYHADGSENGFVKKGAKAQIHGSLLVVSESDDAKATFTNAKDAADVVEVDSFSSKGAQLLEFDTPAALADGAAYSVQVTRSDGDGNMRCSNTKTVKVLPGDAPSHEPHITSGHSESHADDGKCYADGSGFVLEGDNLEDAIVTIAGSANGGETWSYEETIPAEKVNFDADMLTVDGNWLDSWYNHMDVGELVKFTVETTQGEDSIQRTLAS